MSVRGFPNDSECLLHEDRESTGTGKTHGLCGGKALRQCFKKHCRGAISILFTISQTWDVSPGRIYGKQESAHAQVGLPQVNALDWMKPLLG